MALARNRELRPADGGGPTPFPPRRSLMRRRHLQLAAVALVLLTGACADQPTQDPVSGPNYLVRPHNCGGLFGPTCNPQPTLTNATPEGEVLKICKFGSSASIKVDETQS